MSYIYVCLFSNGAIKVGRSISPNSRIAEHQKRVYCVGVDLTESKIFKCKRNEHMCESELILKCITNSSERRKNEWFFGVEFSEACEWAEKISNSVISTIEPVKQNHFQEKSPDIYQRYVCIEPCNASNGGVAKWKDNEPDKYHWETSVMRWHLRPDDWHKIWPELIKAA